MTVLTVPSPLDLQARKTLGQTYLSENRVEDALRVYANILREHPEDIDTYLVLGDCYLAEGDGDAAILFYTQALSHAPDNGEIHRRLRLAELEYRKPAADEAQNIPTEPGAVAHLLTQLTGSTTPISDDEVRQAAALLNEIVNHPRPALAVADRLEEVNALLPALLELNIRQARGDGRPDLAAALQNLLDNIHIQLEAKSPPATPAAKPVSPKVLYFTGEMDAPTAAPLEALSEKGCAITTVGDAAPQNLEPFDLILAHHPHCSLKRMEILAGCAAAKKPIVLLLDADFEQMPADHPQFDALGLGSPARAKAYAIALLLADVICTPSESFAASLRSAGRRVKVVPAGWSHQNGLWEKPAAHRHTVNLGWLGNAGQLEDVAEIRRVMLRVLREFPQTRLVISGDARVYQLFESLPESRKQFLPAMGGEDYPYLLAQVDILMAPLRNLPFNRSLSDLPLVEAGIRGIPWVASSIPSFVAWNTGGLLVNAVDEWHTALRQLVLDENLRAVLGQSGRQKASEREATQLSAEWMKLVYGLVAGR